MSEPADSGQRGPDRQVLVLVTGSGRSGTSALAGSLHKLGLHVPQPMVPAAPRNPKGHFEPVFTIRFHKKLLARAGVYADDASPETAARLSSVLTDVDRTELRDWLAQQSEPRLVVKDPHSMRFLDLWRSVCTELDVDLRYLTALRPPPEVVGSRVLAWGERPDEAAEAARKISNVASWLTVALVTERGTRGGPRSFIRYSDMVTDWRTALGRVSRQLDLDLDTGSAPGTHELDSWLEPGMQRSALTWDDVPVPRELQTLAQSAWEQLDVLVTDPSDTGATQRLDHVSDGYADLLRSARALIADDLRHEANRSRGLVKELRQKNARLRAQLQAQRAAASTASAESAAGPPRRGVAAALTRRLRG